MTLSLLLLLKKIYKTNIKVDKKSIPRLFINGLRIKKRIKINSVFLSLSNYIICLFSLREVYIKK